MDLDIQLLQDGIDGFIKDLRKLPRDARALSVAVFLEGHLKEFKDSLPLLVDLKNEALRERLDLQNILKRLVLLDVNLSVDFNTVCLSQALERADGANRN